MASRDEITRFYDTHYDVLGCWRPNQSKREVLGDNNNRLCRFCGKRPPEATFKSEAHAIPEFLGNRRILSAYECDDCNESFGRGIENELGNWSKPMRTFSRIRGKNGVPTLKKVGDAPGWRIEHRDIGLWITSYDDQPVFEADEANKKVSLVLKSDAYIPLAVVKAFVKIGLTLLPEEELDPFRPLIPWVRNSDESHVGIVNYPYIYSVLRGPVGALTALILRRKHSVSDYPYAFLVISYGMEVFQVPLLARMHDAAINGRPLRIVPFLIPGLPKPVASVPLNVGDSASRERVKGQVIRLAMSYQKVTHTFPERMQRNQ